MWVLRDKDSGSYLKGMSGIGPMLTDEVGEAERFEDRIEAAFSPAMKHSLTCFEPVDLAVGVSKEKQ